MADCVVCGHVFGSGELVIEHKGNFICPPCDALRCLVSCAGRLDGVVRRLHRGVGATLVAALKREGFNTEESYRAADAVLAVSHLNIDYRLASRLSNGKLGAKTITKAEWRDLASISEPSERHGAIRADADGARWEWVSSGKRVAIREVK